MTGAGSGIGRGTALELHKHGYSVTLTGRRLEALEETAAMAAAQGGKMLAISMDVADPESVRCAFAQAVDEFGRLDLLFNNAGTSAPGVPMEELSPEQWRDVVNVNLNGSFFCAQQAIAIMKAQRPKGGRIINNGSVSAHAPRPFAAPYPATKHASTGLPNSMSLAGRAAHIAVAGETLAHASFARAGLAGGVGSLYPNFEEDNPARMVSGMGGTLNFLLSVGYITIVIGSQMLVLQWYAMRRSPDARDLAWALTIVLTCITLLTPAAAPLPTPLVLRTLLRPAL